MTYLLEISILTDFDKHFLEWVPFDDSFQYSWIINEGEFLDVVARTAGIMCAIDIHPNTLDAVLERDKISLRYDHIIHCVHEFRSALCVFPFAVPDINRELLGAAFSRSVPTWFTGFHCLFRSEADAVMAKLSSNRRS